MRLVQISSVATLRACNSFCSSVSILLGLCVVRLNSFGSKQSFQKGGGIGELNFF